VFSLTVNMEFSGRPLFAVEVFSGYWQLNAMLGAKTRKLKALRKESDKAKIILRLTFDLVRDRVFLGTSGKRDCFRSGSVAIACR